jgi:uncharacterized protein YjbI with pentapeptide repeats
MGTQGEAPANRCGFVLEPDDVKELRNIDVMSELDIFNKSYHIATCIRPVCESLGDETDRCVWHMEVDNKPIDLLSRSIGDGSQCLDGAYLSKTDLKDRVDFERCSIRLAEISDCDLSQARFFDCDMRWTHFTDGSDVEQTEYKDSILVHTEFTDIELEAAEFTNSHLGDARFNNCDIGVSDFTNSTLVRAEFTHSDLSGVKFINSDLAIAEFCDSDLSTAEFTECDLSDAKFTNDVVLDESKFEKCDCRDSKFTANEDEPGGPPLLEFAIFEGTDLRRVDFTNACLYETIFTDVRISNSTEFDYTSAYERYPDIELGTDETTRLQKAAWVHRRLQILHEENAMSESARQFHIRKQEAERQEAEGFKWIGMTIMWGLTNHGESLRRVLAWWGVVVIACGLLYPLPFVGGFASSASETQKSTTVSLAPWEGITSLADAALVLSSGASKFMAGIYFSAITFFSIGYSNLYPTGIGSRFLVAFESLAGAVLFALVIYVLGRLVSR